MRLCEAKTRHALHETDGCYWNVDRRPLTEEIHQDADSPTLRTRLFDDADQARERATLDTHPITGVKTPRRTDHTVGAGLLLQKVDDPRLDRRRNPAESHEGLHTWGPDDLMEIVMQDDLDEEVTREQRYHRPIIPKADRLEDAREEDIDAPTFEVADRTFLFARLAADHEPLFLMGLLGGDWHTTDGSKFNAIEASRFRKALTFFST